MNAGKYGGIGQGGDDRMREKKSWRRWVALLVLLLAAMLALLLYLLGRSGKEEQEYETQLTVYENVKPDFSDRKQVDYLSGMPKGESGYGSMGSDSGYGD